MNDHALAFETDICFFLLSVCHTNNMSASCRIAKEVDMEASGLTKLERSWNFLNRYI